MESISNTVWQRQGSCVVFDQKSLGPIITDGALVSLRQALAWSKGMPADPPVPGRTILVSGLETMIETMAPQEGEAFLVHRIRPLLINLQNRWTYCGVVFGFSTHPRAFEETALKEEVLFRRRDRKTVRLSESLWDGSAAASMKRVVREGDQPGQEVIVGYYVARIS
ncbi:MAG: hypothetical protein PHD57_05760 [Desulfobacterales bacterium]|jgi:hypothetical protein|nr:hypothetical protein [Desulfobacterales bacterium]MDD3081619.1 hypothetical protein [Desulfobacterales bacterium]MDD3949752.1 hypothetical protein [Desulfobacterales bacterium]MDD4465009.1 hypothetical protein [Desulfobacterales bacterium]